MEIDKTYKISTSSVIDAIRVRIATGELNREDVTFMVEDDNGIHNVTMNINFDLSKWYDVQCITQKLYSKLFKVRKNNNEQPK